MPERLAMFQYQGWRQFDGLCVGWFGELLVRQLYPYLVDVEPDVRLVFYGEVYEEVVTDSIDIIQAHHHTVRFGSDVAEFRR